MTFAGTLQDGEGRWNHYTGRYAWDPSCICSGDEQYAGTGQPKEGSCFGAAPNLDHSSERVRKVVLYPYFMPSCFKAALLVILGRCYLCRLRRCLSDARATQSTIAGNPICSLQHLRSHGRCLRRTSSSGLLGFGQRLALTGGALTLSKGTLADMSWNT